MLPRQCATNWHQLRSCQHFYINQDPSSACHSFRVGPTVRKGCEMEICIYRQNYSIALLNFYNVEFLSFSSQVKFKFIKENDRNTLIIDIKWHFQARLEMIWWWILIIQTRGVAHPWYTAQPSYMPVNMNATKLWELGTQLYLDNH